MSDIGAIVTKIKKRQYEFSKHAVDQTIVRDISVSEIEQVSSSYLRYGRCDLVDIIIFIYFSMCYNYFNLSVCHIT